MFSFQDPHDELKEQNILIMHNTHEEMSEILGVKSDKLREAIEKAKVIFDLWSLTLIFDLSVSTLRSSFSSS